MNPDLPSRTAAPPHGPSHGPSATSVPLYRHVGENACPECGGHQWLVGRTTAECAVCATALPLDAGAGWRVLRLDRFSSLPEG